MESPFKSVEIPSRESYDTVNEEKEKLLKVRAHFEQIASMPIELRDVHSLVSVVSMNNADIAKINQKLSSLYENAHGAAAEMEKKHQQLVQDAISAAERLSAFETEVLGMHKNEENKE